MHISSHPHPCTLQGFLQPHRVGPRGPVAEHAAAGAAQPAHPAAAPPPAAAWQRLEEPPRFDASAAAAPPRSVQARALEDEVDSRLATASPAAGAQQGLGQGLGQGPEPAAAHPASGFQRVSAGCASSATAAPPAQPPPEGAARAAATAGAADMAQPAAGPANRKPADVQPGRTVRRSSSGRSEASNVLPPQQPGMVSTPGKVCRGIFCPDMERPAVPYVDISHQLRFHPRPCS
jgi:eukaryotic-like serine/threonine-protein kinase